MTTPFKMKGSPMKRNFGISPVKQTLPTKTAGQFTTTSERETIKKQKGNLSSKTKFHALIDRTPTFKATNAIYGKIKNTYKNLDIKGNINNAVDFFTKK